MKNLGVLLSVVGSVAGGFLCFTLPPLLWYKLCQLEGRPVGRVVAVFLFAQILCGLALIAAGLVVIAESAHDSGSSAEGAEAQSAGTASAGVADPNAFYLSATAAAIAQAATGASP